MHAVRLLLLALLLASLGPWAHAFGQDEPETETVQLAGRVVDERDQPQANAEVTALAYGGDRIARSGDDGRFVLTVSAARLSGLVLIATGDDDRLAFLQLPYGDEAPGQPLALVVRPAREVVVDVVDAKGQPLPNVGTAASSEFRPIARDDTDAKGRATLRVPRDAPLQYVYAYEPGVGLDYAVDRREGAPRVDSRNRSAEFPEPVKLVLDGTLELTVRVEGGEGQQLAGVRVSPSYLGRPDRGGHFNMGGLDEIAQTTDATGTVTLRSIPRDSTGKVTIGVHREGYFAPERWTFDPAAPVERITAHLVPLVPVRGKVTLPDGKPAPGIAVHVAGDGHSIDGFRKTVRTREDGTFAIDVAPEMYYQFAVVDEKWASASHTRTVLSGRPQDTIDFELRPATRIFGRVSVGTDREPQVGQSIMLQRLPAEDYYRLPEERRIPNPQGSRHAIRPVIVQHTATDETGRFEFFTGPDTYYVLGPSQSPQPRFEIADEREHEIDLHAERPEKGPITGRVVLAGDDARPVPNANVLGMTTHERIPGFSARTDAMGRFETQRGLAETVVHAWNADHSLAGIVEITAEAEQVVVPIGPTATARGRLIDEGTGEPIGEREIQYGVRIPSGTRGAFTWSFGGTVTTDAIGAFSLNDLVVGRKYDVSAGTERDGNGRTRIWRTVREVTPERAGDVDLGDVELPVAHDPLTFEERMTAAFTPKQPFAERLAGKLRDARLGHQRVLVVAADPSGDATRRFFEHYYGREDELRDAFANWSLLAIDATSENTPAEREWAEKVDLDWPGKGGLVLGTLDEEGRLFARSTGENLTAGGELDTGRLTAFLREHLAPQPDARQLLDDALARAVRENKRVLVQHSGANCAPCVLLSRYLDDHRQLVAKDYVHVTIDARFQRGPAVVKQVRPQEGRGIPWMVILDVEGRPLADADGPDGNIGFPNTPANIAHFEKMLRTTRQKLTDAEIETLLGDLAKDE